MQHLSSISLGEGFGWMLLSWQIQIQNVQKGSLECLENESHMRIGMCWHFLVAVGLWVGFLIYIYKSSSNHYFHLSDIVLVWIQLC